MHLTILLSTFFIFAILGCTSPSESEIKVIDVGQIEDVSEGSDSGEDVDGIPFEFIDPSTRFVQPGAVLELEYRGESDGLTFGIFSTTVEDFECSDQFPSVERSDAVVALSIPVAQLDARCSDELRIDVFKNDAVVANVAFHFRLPDGFGEAWVESRFGTNPVLPLPTCPTWDCLGRTDPSFTIVDDSTIDLWFSAGGDRGAFPVVGRALLNTTTATLAPEPVIEPADGNNGPEAWDYIRETVSIDRRSDEPVAVYLGYKTDYFTDPAISLVRFAPDSSEISRTPSPIYVPERPTGWDAAFISGPMRLRGSDGVWRIYYGGASRSSVGGKIGVLTSENETEWTPHSENPIFQNRLGEWDESIIDCFVIFYAGSYLMFYTGWVEPLTPTSRISIGVARSKDGFVWERVSEQPVLTPGETGAWNDISVVSPHVIVQTNGTLLMAVHGTSSVLPFPNEPDFRPERIGLFESPRTP